MAETLKTELSASDELKRIAAEIYRAWDSDNDSRVGKMVGALGGVRGYRADIDALHDRLNQGQPESAPLAHEDEVLAFLRKQHADMMQAVASRRDSANVLRNCSASDIKAGRKLAMKMSGRKMPHTTVAQERAAADVQDRIASKIEHEADLMQQAIDRLALSAAPPAQPHPSQAEPQQLIKRYKTGGYGAMVEDENGPWVSFDDVQRKGSNEIPCRECGGAGGSCWRCGGHGRDVLIPVAAQPHPETPQGPIELGPCHLHDHFGSGECPDCGVRRKLAEAESRADAQTEALREYAQHKDTCAIHDCVGCAKGFADHHELVKGDCDCGLDALSASPAVDDWLREYVQREIPWDVSQLRHAYHQLQQGSVKDQAAFARGLLGPCIERLERMQALLSASPAPQSTKGTP